jgi:mannose-1-phosphate guanylyltransferase
MQALILTGGEGTRLRPLTSTIPKPVVPLVGHPLISYMVEWLRGHGIDDVILACGFMAEAIRKVLGDGEALGVRLRYIEEPEPLGTGGALKYAEDLLDERFFMLNGDVLTDIDLSAQLRHHEESGARATLALIGVEDPSQYGLVRLDPLRAVTDFVEKPNPDEIDTNLINAGAYILQRDVLQYTAPAGQNCSIEHDVFPKLVGHGLYGYPAEGYWLDIGTPARYLQATADILAGTVHTSVEQAMASSGGIDAPADAGTDSRLVGPLVIGAGAVIGHGARIGPGVFLGAAVSVGPGAVIERSAVLNDTKIGDGTHVRDAIIGQAVTVGPECVVEAGAVLGAGVRVGPHNVISAGARIFPGVELPEGAIKF